MTNLRLTALLFATMFFSCATGPTAVYESCRIELDLCVELCSETCRGTTPCPCNAKCQDAANACDRKLSTQED